MTFKGFTNNRALDQSEDEIKQLLRRHEGTNAYAKLASLFVTVTCMETKSISVVFHHTCSKGTNVDKFWI